MYFDDPVEKLDRPIGRDMAIVLAATGLFTTLFFVFPALIMEPAAQAARSLFAG